MKERKMHSRRFLLLSVVLSLILGVSLQLTQAQDGFKIGLSNGFIGSEWRTQMIANMQATADELTAAGTPVELVIESGNVDVQGQIQQIQNLINQGVDAIIVNPNDIAALNATLEEATEQGIVVISVDQEISAQGVYNVVIDQKEWAKISARWLAEALNGAGDIVLIEGFVGHPANEARMAGVEEVLAEYPDIHVVGRESGMWDQATGQQVMSDLLASTPNIDGVWTQDGMAQGVLTALITAAPAEFPIVSGEARTGYLKLWQEQMTANADFQSFGVVNPPGIGASGMRVAVEILKGGEVDPDKLAGEAGNTLYVPIPYTVNADNFAEVFEEFGGLEDSYTLDGMITQDEAQTFMVDVALKELAGTGPYKIGLSNGFIGSEWRTQMIANMEAQVEAYNAAGLTVELVIESGNVDVQGQIQQIQNLINQGVDAIIINPNDIAALNATLEEATEQGIVVISIDQEISAQGVYNVVIDQKEWAKLSAQWLADALGGAGDIVLIEGFVGHPANEARMAGVEEVLAAHPDIHVVGRESGMWDQATGQQVMSDLLASTPNIDGVWTQDGMAQGVLTALITAAPAEFPIVSGEARTGYLKLWQEQMDANPAFQSFGVVNPPGIGVSGMRVAIEILSGETVDTAQLAGESGNTLYVPIPYTVSAENFDAIFAQYGALEDSYTLDGTITQGQADAFMVQQ
jgi:ribose transport system substrate-binding protein